MKRFLKPLFFALIALAMGNSIQAQGLVFTMGSGSGLPGDTIDLQITVTNFTGISGYQGTVRWDSSVLEYVAWSNPTPGIGNFFGAPGQGLIPEDGGTFTWINFSGGTTTLANGTPVMQISLRIKATAPSGPTAIVIDGSVTNLGFSTGSGLQPLPTNPGTITVTGCISTADPGFTYPSVVCQNAANPLATITGDTGGRFSVNNGAQIDSLTGELDLATTLPGTYLVTYRVGASCPAFQTESILVNPLDDASFTIADTVCQNSSNPVAQLTGLQGGVFTVDNGASINTQTGELDLSSTQTGSSYRITYSTNGPCPDTSSRVVFVQALDDPSFAVTDSICFSGSNPIPLVSGTPGGLFSVNSGLGIDSLTGEIFLGTATPGTQYSITYTTQGQCPNSSSQAIFVADSLDAGFTYPASVVCVSQGNPLATLTGNPGGSFSVFPAASIDSLTGELDLATTANGTTYTITYALDDVCQSFSNKNIFVGDTIPPVAPSLPSLFGECSVTAVVPTGTDNCDGSITATTTDSLVYPSQGNFTITWTFTDAQGNQSTAQQTVVVQDTVAPVVVCKNTSLTLDVNGSAVLNPADLNNGSFDACGIASFAVSQTVFTPADLGPNTVTLIVTDVNGNVDSCFANVVVIAYPLPVAICRNSVLFLDSTGMGVLQPLQVDGGSFANIGQLSLSVNQDTFDCNSLGVNQVTLFATDGNGAFTTCQSDVIVRDTVSPSVVANDLTVYLDSGGMAQILADDLDQGSFDACGIESRSIDQSTFDCSSLGANAVMLTLSDSSANSSAKTVTVTVADSISPIVSCRDVVLTLDSTGVAVLLPDSVDNGSSDNCGIQSLVLSQDTFGINDIGEQNVILTATDASGNASDCEVRVTVRQDPTSIESAIFTSMKVFPNPTEGLLRVDLKNSYRGEISLELLNPLGERVLSQYLDKRAERFSGELHLGSLANGIYFLRVAIDGELTYMRVVKQ